MRFLHLEAHILLLLLLLLTSLLAPPSGRLRCSDGCSEPAELQLPSEPSAARAAERRLLWMASRSSSLTMGEKLVKSSRVSEPGGDKQGTRAEQLMSASEGPEC